MSRNNHHVNIISQSQKDHMFDLRFDVQVPNELVLLNRSRKWNLYSLLHLLGKTYDTHTIFINLILELILAKGGAVYRLVIRCKIFGKSNCVSSI